MQRVYLWKKYWKNYFVLFQKITEWPSHRAISLVVVYSQIVRETKVRYQVESYQRLKKYLMPSCLTLIL